MFAFRIFVHLGAGGFADWFQLDLPVGSWLSISVNVPCSLRGSLLTSFSLEDLTVGQFGLLVGYAT